MSSLPIFLFDFDGVVITQKALEYAGLMFKNDSFFQWKNIEKLRLIDFARLFEVSDSTNRIKAFMRIIKVYRPYIPRLWRRIIFFIKFRRFYPNYEKYETLKPDLGEVLLKFKEKGFLLGIVSGTSRNRLNFYRYRLNLDKFFSLFISRQDYPYRKPDPISILTALKQFKKKFNLTIDKRNIFYIGDLPHDIECAKNAGINSIAVLSGHGTIKSLEDSKPTYLISEIKNLLEIEDFKKFLID